MKRQENVLDRREKKTQVSTQNASEPHSVSAAQILDFEYEKGILRELQRCLMITNLTILFTHVVKTPQWSQRILLCILGVKCPDVHKLI